MLPLFPLALGLWLATSPTFFGDSRGRSEVRGTFIQLQRWMLELSAADWEKELDAARKLGIQTLVLQWSRYDDTSFVSNDGGKNGLDFIFEEADRHGMRIFLGLAFDSSWWQRWKDEAYLSAPVDVAPLWQRFGSHRSFAGWYLPQEFPTVDLPDAEIDRLAAFYRRLAESCRRYTALPVALSTFLGHASTPLPSEGVEHVLQRLLSRAQVDIVLIQDGAGMVATDELTADSLAFLQSAIRAAERAQVVPWGIMEIFETSPAGRQPTSWERFVKLWRLEGENPLVLFDYFHYLSPYRGERQAALYSRLLASGGIRQQAERRALRDEQRRIELVPHGSQRGE